MNGKGGGENTELCNNEASIRPRGHEQAKEGRSQKARGGETVRSRPSNHASVWWGTREEGPGRTLNTAKDRGVGPRRGRQKPESGSTVRQQEARATGPMIKSQNATLTIRVSQQAGQEARNQHHLGAGSGLCAQSVNEGAGCQLPGLRKEEEGPREDQRSRIPSSSHGPVLSEKRPWDAKVVINGRWQQGRQRQDTKE